MHWLNRGIGQFRGCALAQLIGCLMLLGPSTLFAYAQHDMEFDAGFLASRRVLDDGTVRMRALGPFWEHRTQGTNTSFSALRPVYSFQEDLNGERRWYDLLWPLGSRRDLKASTSARLLMTYYMNADRNHADSAWRFWLLPLYFQGRSDKGVDYRALFPIAGNIRGIFMQDRVSFLLFPLKLNTVLNEVEGKGWLWPVYSRTQGDGIDRFRVFPFYGRSTRGDDYEKRFILWPFYTEATYGPDYGNGKGWILFPFVGHLKLADQEGYWLFPPFFRYHRGERQDLYYMPWPFVQIAHGETEKFYLWPLWGKRVTSDMTRTFALWPFITHRTLDTPAQAFNQWTVWPFWYSDSQLPGAKAPDHQYRKFWPLFSYKAQGEESRFRMLDLWPARDHLEVERNWSPLWTLFETNRRGPERETELLWGLFRKLTVKKEYSYWSIFPFFDSKRNLEAKDSEWNVLKGLLGRERDDGKTRWKFLYFMNWETKSP